MMDQKFKIVCAIMFSIRKDKRSLLFVGVVVDHLEIVLHTPMLSVARGVGVPKLVGEILTQSTSGSQDLNGIHVSIGVANPLVKDERRENGPDDGTAESSRLDDVGHSLLGGGVARDLEVAGASEASQITGVGCR